MTKLIVFISLVLFASQAFAAQPQNSADNCKSALQPTIKQAQSDYRSVQSYMFIHATEIYDHLQTLDKSDREAEASYKLFSAEFHDSKTSAQFKDRIDKRLQQEQFSSNVADAKSLTKQYLTDTQLKSWVECLRIMNQQPQAVLLSARNITKEGFTLRIDIALATNQISTKLELQIENGTIKGIQPPKEISAADHWNRSYFVRSSPGQSSVTILANVEEKNVGPATDDIVVNLVKKQEQYIVSDFLDEKWSNNRAHISWVLDSDGPRKEYYGALLKKHPNIKPFFRHRNIIPMQLRKSKLLALREPIFS